MKFGSISLLLDGLDEIKIELINKFQKRIEEFIDEYPNVIIVISLRPFQEFIGFNRFSVLEVKPFTNGYYSWVSAIFVDMRDSTELCADEDEEKLAKVFRSFSSEIIEILRDDDNL